MEYKSLIEEGLVNKHKQDAPKDKVKKNRADKRRSGQSATGVKKRRVTITGDVSKIMAGGMSPRRGGKTGTPDWFSKIKDQGEIRRALRNTSTKKLEVPNQPDAGKILHEAGLRNLWTLSQADLNDLMRVDSLKTGTLRAVRRALLAYGITVKWQIS